MGIIPSQRNLSKNMENHQGCVQSLQSMANPSYSDSISRPSKTDLDGFQMTFHRSQEKRTLAIFLNFHKHFLFQKHGSSCNILQCLDTYDIL